jgi:tRNA (guanine37-N1)-methyltransferase
MKTFIFVSIFPEIYDSFLNQSLIGKAQARQTIKCICVNPRDFCKDRHRQVDDVVYGG